MSAGYSLLASLPLAARRLGMLAVLAALSGCGVFGTKPQEQALKDLEWQYAPDAIHLNVMADPSLNMAGGQPHTVLLVVVQMDDPSAFTPYMRDRERLVQLLLAEAPPDGMLDLQRLFIEPGGERALKLPRATSARYVGVVAGFNHLAPPRSARLYQIGIELSRKGWLFRKYAAMPEPLEIRLRLGSDGIQDSASARASTAAPQATGGGMVWPDGGRQGEGGAP